jgi:hypothetical protein
MATCAWNLRKWLVIATIFLFWQKLGLFFVKYLILIMDRAAWHTTGKIKCFDNIIPMPLPPYDRNHHQKPTFHPLEDFLNPALTLLGKCLPINEAYKEAVTGKNQGGVLVNGNNFLLY